jgi:hypothetical protein
MHYISNCVRHGLPTFPDTVQILQSSRGVLACALGGYKDEIVSDYDLNGS